MNDDYFAHVDQRRALSIPPLPLSPSQVRELCTRLEKSDADAASPLLDLLANRVAPGVDPAAEVKAAWLTDIAFGRRKAPALSPAEATRLLGTMLGGYNIQPLITLLDHDELADHAVRALSGTILVYDAFDTIVEKSRTNAGARQVLQAWANADWFTSRPRLPEQLPLVVYKVDGEINTDDFSPAGHAWSRADIPLHANSMGESRFPDGIDQIHQFRHDGHQVVFVGDVVGTGSSRKSACNSLMWHIGQDIPYVPNKRRAGIVMGGLIAPIFFNTAQDSGGFPIMCDVSDLATGQTVILEPYAGRVLSESGSLLTRFDRNPSTILDEFQAGGRLNLIIGRTLTRRARQALDLPESTAFVAIEASAVSDNQPYTLAQKIVGRACGLPGVLPGTPCEPRMTTVGSQDTTGLMTADELQELACLRFQSDLFMQSFCHTAAYPKSADVRMHQTLPGFITERGGVSLSPGDGVIHSWLNRLLLPDTVGTGGDSHTRFPIGISFPAGSGLVAFAGALGFMPLDMPESVLVRFSGKPNSGITLRDIVNAIPYFAIQAGLLTVEKQNKKNIFNGRILEMQGLPDLTVEQAFELTDAAAERSAAAATIQLNPDSVIPYIQSNIALMSAMIDAGFADAETLNRRIADCQKWLDHPTLLTGDPDASYAAVLDIDLSEISEPILACPNDPDDVRLLSQVAGTAVQEVFIGSCMTNIGHFRAAAQIWSDAPYLPARTWMAPPTRMDEAQLKREGVYSIFSKVGVRTEIPGCSLCMGNQARVRPETTVFSTSTRNFDNRIGTDTRVFLGSAELAAMVARTGTIPDPKDYFAMFESAIHPYIDTIYSYLTFDKMTDPILNYQP